MHISQEEPPRTGPGGDALPQAEARLAEMGIVVEAAAVQEQSANTRGSSVIAGLADTKVDGADMDVLVLDDGLILVPVHDKKKGGKDRMVELLRSTAVEQLSASYRYLPYEEIKSVTITKAVPLRARIDLHNGQSTELRESWTGETLHSKSSEVTRKVLERFVEAS